MGSGKSLRINVHPRVIQLGRILLRGERTFSELSERDKELLVQSNVSLEGLADEEEIEAYKLAKQLRGDEGRLKQAIAQARASFGEVKPDEKALNNTADET